MEDKEKLGQEKDQLGQPPQPETNDQVMRDAIQDKPATHEGNVGDDVKVNEALLSDVPIENKADGSNATVKNQLKPVDKHVGVGELKNGPNDTEVPSSRHNVFVYEWL